MDDQYSSSVDYQRGLSSSDCTSHGDAAISTTPMGSPPKSALPPSARPYWEMSDLTKKLIYIEVASVVIAIMTGMRLGRYATLQKYAFSVAVVSLAVTVWVRKQDRDNRKILDEEAGTFADGSKITKEYLVGVFLCLWWFVGALIMTFVGPYTITSNGYFAAVSTKNGYAKIIMLIFLLDPSLSLHDFDAILFLTINPFPVLLREHSYSGWVAGDRSCGRHHSLSKQLDNALPV